MVKRKHPDAKLTLAEAYEKHYDKSELRPGSEQQFHYTLLRWRMLTDDPPIGEITNETLAAFRQALIAHHYAAGTIKSSWINIRSILRRLAKPITGNPRGLGIIDLIPWMRPVRSIRKPPRRVSQDDLSLFYIACDVAQFPRSAGYPPAEYWRSLAVMAYFTGLRKSDLFGIELCDIDLSTAELYFTAEKTGKKAVFPLHPVAVDHIKRIWSERKLLFNGMNTRGGDYTARWRRIVKQAGVDSFTLHDLRRTGASEIDRVQPGMGAVFLQHRPLDVTGISYLNKCEELKECVERMRVPIAFKHGPRMADREEIKARKKREAMMRESQFSVPTKPAPDEWQFTPESFWFRGDWHTLKGAPWRVLKVLAESDGAVDVLQLAEAIFGNAGWPREFYRVTGRVNACISVVRDRLRRILYLDDSWNPCPCLERGRGGKWTLLIPPQNGRPGK